MSLLLLLLLLLLLFHVFFFPQIVLVKDKKKVFSMVDHGYEATVGAIHPGGTTVAIGGGVSGPLKTLDHYWKSFRA